MILELPSGAETALPTMFAPTSLLSAVPSDTAPGRSIGPSRGHPRSLTAETPAPGICPGDSPSPARRVLVADGLAINRLVAIRLLEQLGCAGTAAIGYHSAVEARERGEFDLILLAFDLPGGGGPATALAIRRREADLGLDRSTILGVTDRPGGEDWDRWSEAGMDGHLARPITRARLQDAIEGRYEAGPIAYHAGPPIRVSDLIERCQGDAGLAGAVLDSFRQATPRGIEDLKDRAARGDFRALTFEAHGLKGSAATVGALPFSAACSKLEAAARAGNLAGVESALAGALAAWSALDPALESAGKGVGP